MDMSLSATPKDPPGDEGRPILDGWVPSWERSSSRPSTPIRGYFLAAITGDGVATLLQLDADLDRRAIRQWIAGRFAAQLEGLTEESAAEEISFAYLLIYEPLWEKSPRDKYGNLVIVGRGIPPACPEEWGQRPFADLLKIAIRDLDGN